MKCFKHYESDASAQCSECSRGLCPSCSDNFDVPICDKCLLKSADARFMEIVTEFILSTAIFIGFILWIKSNTKLPLPWKSPLIFMPYMLATIPFGWKFLSRFTQRYGLIMNPIGWGIYLILKLWLSAIAGAFIAPYSLYKAIIDIRSIRDLKASLRSDQYGPNV